MKQPKTETAGGASFPASPVRHDGLQWLIGMEVQADHPVTCLNPAPTFQIHEAKIDERGKLFVRGEETMWFHGGMISLPNISAQTPRREQTSNPIESQVRAFHCGQ
jgi:hypothetical protein